MEQVAQVATAQGSSQQIPGEHCPGAAEVQFKPAATGAEAAALHALWGQVVIDCGDPD